MIQELEKATVKLAFGWLALILLQVPLPVVHHHSEMPSHDVESHTRRHHAGTVDQPDSRHADDWHVHFRSIWEAGWTTNCGETESHDPCGPLDRSQLAQAATIRSPIEVSIVAGWAIRANRIMLEPIVNDETHSSALPADGVGSRRRDRAQLGSWIC